MAVLPRWKGAALLGEPVSPTLLPRRANMTDTNR